MFEGERNVMVICFYLQFLPPVVYSLLHATLSLTSHADDFESIANRAAAARLQEKAASAKDKQ
jgi:hypothetical protein